MASSHSVIPTCHLYTLEPSQRIHRELLELGIDLHLQNDDAKSTQELLDVRMLNKVDNMRYEGGEGTRIFHSYLDSRFGPDEDVSVLDIGAGFGGPSRLLALTRPSTHIVALELVPEISQVAEALTERTTVSGTKGHSSSVSHATGDVSTYFKDKPSNLQSFGAAQAVLALMHVPNLLSALEEVAARLDSEKGMLYIEDFFVSFPPTMPVNQMLKDIVGCVAQDDSGDRNNGIQSVIRTREEWITLLKRAGFNGDIVFHDVSPRWQPWVHDRSSAYSANIERHERVHGIKEARHMLEFYQTMDRLFCGKELRGCRIVAFKK